jgi:hypothetical protein
MRRTMRMKLLTAILLACAAPAFPLLAQAATSNSAYATLGYTGATLGNAHPSAWSIRAGYYFAPQLAGMIQVLNRGNGDGGLVIDSGVGAFVRGEAPIGRRFRVYVLAGYAYTDLIGPLGKKITISNLTYGAGAELDLGSRASLDLDYLSYNNNSKVNGINAGVKFSF